jgi:2,5-furandicarboxylate decarboxylase 1
MAAEFRAFLDLLAARGELQIVDEEVDIRSVSARVAASPKALWFKRVRDYEMGVVSGILGSRERMAACLDCDQRDIGRAFLRRIQNRCAPVMVESGPVNQVIKVGDEVDLTALPIPLISELDGGPYITSAIGVAKDPEYGRNVGAYRLMLRTERETGIDLVSASDLKLFYDRALKQGKSLPFAVAIGTHPSLLMGAAHMAPAGQDEYELAGGLAGEPIKLVKCQTVDLEVPADAEMVLEGELLATGWSEDEGRFGDFTGFVGPLKWNPVFRVNAITHRRDPVFYALHMPDEVDYLVAPPLEGSGWQALANAGITATAVYAPKAAGCNFNLYASIKKRAGEGKNAVLALMPLKRVKHVVVTDHDVDIFNHEALERAITYRVRPAHDIIVVDGARGSHLDPSIQLQVTKGALAPVTGKWGLDATIPEGADLSEYESITYPFRDAADLPVSSQTERKEPAQLAEDILAYLSEPRHFYDVLRQFSAVSQRDIVRAWSLLRLAKRLGREEETGRYVANDVKRPA